MRRMILALILLLVVPATSSAAVKKVLLPIAIGGPVQGAFGSEWATRLKVVNTADVPIGAGLFPVCNFDPCSPENVPPHRTSEFSLPGRPGAFAFIEEQDRPAITLSLRVFDVSRQLTDWGTEMPVIDEDRALTRPAELLGVPVIANFRSLIRIYDFDPASGHAVRVRVYAPSGIDDVLLSETVLTLQVAADFLPGYAEMNLANVPPVPGNGEFRVEVVPITPGLRFWTFASITNDATQHVTIVTP